MGTRSSCRMAFGARLGAVLLTIVLQAVTSAAKRPRRFSPLHTVGPIRPTSCSSDLWVSVKEFGALGDNHSDNTAAFTLALANASKGGGVTVLVPPGMYRFSGNLTIPAGVTLAGSYDTVPSHDLRSSQSLED